MRISNEVGFMMELGIRYVLLGGHPGKLSKVTAGVMQTPQQIWRCARGDYHPACAHGAPVGLIEGVYGYRRSDEADCRGGFYDGVWERMAYAEQRYCSQRMCQEVQMDIAYLDTRGNIIGKTME